MKLRYVDLLKGLEFALNYHSIDAKVNMADFKLAELLGPQVIHGAECAKRGQDAAMTPMLKTTLAHLSDAPEPVDLGKPSDIEVIAERLAKVEDGWAGLQGMYIVHKDLLARYRDQITELNARIDKVAEIIGERVSGLVDRLDKLERPWEHPPLTPAFPTGGASTAEAAAEAVLPVPQRGDRVQIAPNTKTLGGANLRQQWAVVIGVSDGGNLVQVELDGEGDTRSIPWIDHADIMEVRHAQ